MHRGRRKWFAFESLPIIMNSNTEIHTSPLYAVSTGSHQSYHFIHQHPNDHLISLLSTHRLRMTYNPFKAHLA
jgi:hypothetical protein